MRDKNLTLEAHQEDACDRLERELRQTYYALGSLFAVAMLGLLVLFGLLWMLSQPGLGW